MCNEPFSFFGGGGWFLSVWTGTRNLSNNVAFFLLVSPLYKRWLLLPFLDNKWDKINIRPLIIENRYIAQIFWNKLCCSWNVLKSRIKCSSIIPAIVSDRKISQEIQYSFEGIDDSLFNFFLHLITYMVMLFSTCFFHL